MAGGGRGSVGRGRWEATGDAEKVAGSCTGIGSSGPQKLEHLQITTITSTIEKIAIPLSKPIKQCSAEKMKCGAAMLTA